MAIGGLLLKGTSSSVRLLQLAGSAAILGIFSWFLAYLSTHHLHQATYVRAVEGIAGAAVIYTFFAAILTCFIGGLTISAVLAILLDIAFCGGFIAVAILTRASSHSCRGIVNTPIAVGDSDPKVFNIRGSNNVTYHPNLHRACMLQKACFAIAIILAGLFLLSILTELALMRHHKSEKRYGPSPNNNYTAGSGRRFGFMGRNKKGHNHHDAELATVGAAGVAAEGKHHHDHHNGTGNGVQYNGVQNNGVQHNGVVGDGYRSGTTNGVHGVDTEALAHHHATPNNPSGYAA